MRNQEPVPSRGLVLWLASGLLAALLTAPPPRAWGWAAPPALRTAEQKKRLAERDQLLYQAQSLQAGGKLADAISAASKAHAIDREVNGRHSSAGAAALERLARLHEGAGDFAAARSAWGELLAARARLLGPDDWRTTDARLGRANAEARGKLTAAQHKELADAPVHRPLELARQNKHAEAVSLARKTLDTRRRLLGGRHPDTAYALLILAATHNATKDRVAAGRAFQEAVGLYREVHGELHPAHAYARFWLAIYFWETGKLPLSEAEYLRGLGIRRRLFGDGDPEFLRVSLQLAGLYRQAGNPDKEAPVLRHAVKSYREQKSPPRDLFVSALCAMAELRRKDSLSEAESLYLEAEQVARFYTRSPEYGQAVSGLLAVRKQARDEGRRRLGEKGDGYRALVVSHAASHFRLGRLAGGDVAATRFHQAILALVSEGLPADHWAANDARAALARVALDARLDYGQKARLARAASLDSSVRSSFGFGNYADALLDARESLAIREKVLGPDHLDVSLSLNNLGMVHRAMGELPQAARLLRRAWETRRRVLGDGHPRTALTLNNLGLVAFDSGDFVQAERCLRQSLAESEKAIPTLNRAHLNALNNLAVLCQAIGAHARSESALREALSLHLRTAKNTPAQRREYFGYWEDLSDALSGSLNWAGALPSGRPVYRSPGDYDYSAEIVYRNNLAGAMLCQGRPDEAEKQFLLAAEAYRLAVDARPSTAPTTRHALTMHNLGLLYVTRKKYAEAGKCLAQALEARLKDRWVGEKHPDTAATLTALGSLHYARGEWEKAGPYFRRALAARREHRARLPLNYAAALSNLALLHDARGEGDKALPLAREAVGVCRGHLEAVAAIQTERQQLALLQTFRGMLDHFVSLSLRSKSPGKDVYGAILAWKGSVFARQRRLRERQAARQAGGKAARLYGELEEVTRSLARRAADPGARPKELATLGERREQLERDLAGLAPVVRGRREAERLAPEKLQALLPADVALVDYLEFQYGLPPEKGKTHGERQTRLLAVVVRRDGPVTLHDLGPAGPVRKAAGQWRSTTRRRFPVTGKDGPAAQLRLLAWAPLEKRLGGAKTVLVSPDGALCRVPFAALPGKGEGKYLIEELAVAVVPVPQALPGLLARKPAAKGEEESILLVGDVDYDAVGGEAKKTRPWERLPDTRGEMLGVRDSFEQKFPFPDGQTFVLRGGRATESNFRREAPRRRWLHLATHGYFAPADLTPALAGAQKRGAAGFHPGLLSGIVLAGANREPGVGEDDGVLTALEVAGLDLGRVELATLSACQTGLGEEAGGEGLLGLQRAFQVAGCKSVVASLWSVDDQATRYLMERFYENLWQKGHSRAEALRQAQLWMLREGEKRGMVRRDSVADKGKGRTPPYYWAAFVLSGDWR